MAVTTFPVIERLSPLVDLQIHQVSLKKFHYHTTGVFPYNLLISVIGADGDRENFFLNCETQEKTILEVGHTYILPCHVPIQFERTPDFTVVTLRFNLTFFYGLDIFDSSCSIEDIVAPDFTAFLKSTLLSAEDRASGDVEFIKTALTLKMEVTRLCLGRWPVAMQELTPRMWRYEKAFLYAREHCDATLTVGRLAEVHEMRQDVFSRAFSRDLGVSPKQYITDLLLRKVSGYLLTSQMSIKEIARELRFSSEYYLSRFFKKHTNLSPTEYKKQVMGPVA